MRGARARGGALPAIAATLVVLAVPASAAAESFRGKTAQGEPVTLETRPDGEVRKVVWRWSTTDCEDSELRLKTQSTVLKDPPGNPGSFASKGAYSVRYSDAKIRFKISSAGRQRSSGRWRGSFKAKAVVDLEDGDEVICKLRRIDWSAKVNRQ